MGGDGIDDLNTQSTGAPYVDPKRGWIDDVSFANPSSYAAMFAASCKTSEKEVDVFSFGDTTDGLSNTAALSETIIGNNF